MPRLAPTVAALIAAGALVALLIGLSGGDDPAASKHFTPAPTPTRAALPGGEGFLTAEILRSVRVRERPGGRVTDRLTKRTEWNLPRTMSVVRRRGRWLGVSMPRFDPGRLGWIPAKAARLGRVDESLRVDLSRRELVFRRGKRKLRRFRIAIGRPANPTPVGRLAVTDLLRVGDPNSPYGCCAIALTSRQVHLPPGWPGGDRLALHATHELSSIGTAASFGCMRATSDNVRFLMRRLPLGTPVFVRR